jgi:hypothetical protein
MAEALAVLGALAAVHQLSKSAAKLANILYDFALSSQILTKEVQSFARQVRSFSDIVRLALLTLSEYCRENPNSRIVRYLDSHHVLPNINEGAKHTLRHLRAIRDQITRPQTRFTWMGTVVWLWNKRSVMELYPKMESIKSNLSLLMATSKMEDLLHRMSAQDQRSGELKEEM